MDTKISSGATNFGNSNVLHILVVFCTDISGYITKDDKDHLPKHSYSMPCWNVGIIWWASTTCCVCC